MMSQFVSMLIEDQYHRDCLVWFPAEICLDAAKEFILIIGDGQIFTLDLGNSNWVFGSEEDWQSILDGHY